MNRHYRRMFAACVCAAPAGLVALRVSDERFHHGAPEQYEPVLRPVHYAAAASGVLTPLTSGSLSMASGVMWRR